MTARIWNTLVLAAILAVGLLALAGPATSQTLKIATGSAKLTYSTMFKELQNACGNEVPMTEVATTGSIENINLLVGNQVNGAIVQTDVLHWRARTEELGHVRTLIALHNEQVHIITRAQSGLKVGGKFGTSFGAQEVTFTDLSSLAGYRVAAAGGSTVTAQVIRIQSEIAFNVVPMDTNDAVLKAVADGTVEAGLFVGGQPLPLLAALGPEFKLLPISAAVSERLKGVYRPARLNYPKMQMQGITTVATDALFVTREYKTDRMLAGLAKFRACALRQIEEIKETTGTHPAWQAVDTANRGKWAYYELPTLTAAKK